MDDATVFGWVMLGLFATLKSPRFTQKGLCRRSTYLLAKHSYTWQLLFAARKIFSCLCNYCYSEATMHRGIQSL